MSEHPAFELVREQQIPEINSLARLYRHKKTGAEVLSLVNDDENKVFGITFKTPPEDFDRRRPHPRALGAVRLAQVSGEEAVRGAAQGLAPHLPQRHDLLGQDRLSGGQPEPQGLLQPRRRLSRRGVLPADHRGHLPAGRLALRARRHPGADGLQGRGVQRDEGRLFLGRPRCWARSASCRSIPTPPTA